MPVYWQVKQLIMSVTVLTDGTADYWLLTGGTADHVSDCVDRWDSWLLTVLTCGTVDHDSDLSGGTADFDSDCCQVGQLIMTVTVVRWNINNQSWQWFVRWDSWSWPWLFLIGRTADHDSDCWQVGQLIMTVTVDRWDSWSWRLPVTAIWREPRWSWEERVLPSSWMMLTVSSLSVPLFVLVSVVCH